MYRAKDEDASGHNLDNQEKQTTWEWSSPLDTHAETHKQLREHLCQDSQVAQVSETPYLIQITRSVLYCTYPALHMLKISMYNDISGITFKVNYKQATTSFKTTK